MSLRTSPEPSTPAHTAAQSENTRNILQAALAAGWILLLVCLGLAWATPAQRLTYLALSALPAALALTLAWFLQRRGWHLFPLSLLFTTMLFWMTALNGAVEGLGLISSLATALVLIAIAWQTLPRRSAAIASLLTSLASLAFPILDATLAPGSRLAAGLLVKELMIISGGLLFFILVLNSLRSVDFHSLTAQISVSFFIISFIPLFILLILQTVAQVDFLTAQANSKLVTNATSLANNLDARLLEDFAKIGEDSIAPEIVRFFQSPNLASNLAAGLAFRYNNLLSYGLLDPEGNLLLDNRGNTAGNEKLATYFQKAAVEQTIYLSDVVNDAETGKRIYYASAPVKDAGNQLIGVIRIKFDAQLLQETAQKAVKEFGAGSTVLILDDANIVLAHSSAPESLARLLTIPDFQQVTALQLAGRLTDGPVTSLNLGGLAQQLSSTPEKNPFASSVFPGHPELDRLAFTNLRAKPWKVLVAQHPSEYLAPAFSQLTTLGMSMLIVMAVVFFGANLTAAQLISPIHQLAAAALKIGSGNLETSARLARTDELGTLSAVLDATASEVRNLLETLESRVAARTAEISATNEINQRRTLQLETISRVARAITSLSDPEELLPEIARQISISFGYYHVGIFLLDEGREFAVLRAANSPGGRKMLARGHQLKVGREGIVGYATNTGQARVALDVGTDAVYFNNPDLPETRSEIALPLQIGGNIIGALDVQSTAPQAFSNEDVKSLSLLSDQISIAIENARLYETTRSALRQLQQAYAEAGGETATSGYRFVRGTLEPLPPKSDSSPQAEPETLEIPIILRGERLGALKIRRAGQGRWSETEIRMYQAITERMAFALENARLFSDARRRANLEKLTAETSAKISSSNQFETILRTAAEEISRILDGSEVLVQIQPTAFEQSKKQDQ